MTRPRSKRFVRVALAILFLSAAVAHFVMPAPFLAIMPPYVPYPLAMVYLSGAFELFGGLGLLLPATRRWAGIGLAMLLLAVFPANVHMWLADIPFMGRPVPGWVHAIRLPLQFVLIALVVWSTRSSRPAPRPESIVQVSR